MKEHGEVPDLYVEKLLLDELPAGEKKRLLENPEVRRRLAELEASNGRIMAEHPPGAMAEAIRRRLGSRLRRLAISAQQDDSAGPARRARQREAGGRIGLRRLVPAFAAGVVVLAAAAVVATRWTTFFAPQSPAEEIRPKGGAAHLVAYRSAAQGAEPLRDGDLVEAGDTLQIGYAAGGEAYGVIVSLDGRGAVTVHLPIDSSLAAPLDQEGIVLLPFAYRLDDAPGFERFFFVTSDREFRLEQVVEPVRRLAAASGRARTGRLELPEGLEQTSLLLSK